MTGKNASNKAFNRLKIGACDSITYPSHRTRLSPNLEFSSIFVASNFELHPRTMSFSTEQLILEEQNYGCLYILEVCPYKDKFEWNNSWDEVAELMIGY